MKTLMRDTLANNSDKGVRNSSIELFRIVTMLVIVAHHFVVNSGVTDLIFKETSLTVNAVFLLLFGWGGKTGINCFILITGYFMCKSNISLRKFLKLILWMEFYKVAIYFIFLISGYSDFSVKDMIKVFIPIGNISNGFGSAYIVFFLFIPFLNILINGLTKKMHLILIVLCLCAYTVWAFIGFEVVFNYVTWFSIIYILASYIRLYPEEWFSNNKIWGALTIATVLVSWLSLIAGYLVKIKYGMNLTYYCVADSNKPLAVFTAVCAFMFFKNLKIGYVKPINTIAASAFGVLLIHANSDSMRQFLWKDTLNNIAHYESGHIILFAICSVLGVYIICTLIDMLRIKLLEKPFFGWYDKHFKK